MNINQFRRKIKKILNISLIILGLVFIGFIYTRYFFVVGMGVKSGQLSDVVYEGYLFKTYEGRLIQTGFKPDSATGASVLPEEFAFSVSDKKIAEKLMLQGGKDVDLHYSKYMGTLPWRGCSKYVVDSIIDIKK